MAHFEKTAFCLFTALILTACSNGQEPTQAATPVPAQATPQTEQATKPDNAAQAPSGTAAVRPEIQSYEIVATYPHDTDAFTQGLFFWNGILYESTGKYGKSTIRKTEIETGEVTSLRDLPPEYFGEGITRWQDKIIALTWRSGTGFVIDLETLSPKDAFGYPGEGWGITASEAELVQSDGSHILRFIDPETFAINRTLTVNLNGRPLSKLNELEWINGEIWESGHRQCYRRY